MIDAMEAQRTDFPDRTGGFLQLTSVSEHLITTRILRRWDQPTTSIHGDRVGRDVALQHQPEHLN
jgi:hypothetical protein